MERTGTKTVGTANVSVINHQLTGAGHSDNCIFREVGALAEDGCARGAGDAEVSHGHHIGTAPPLAHRCWIRWSSQSRRHVVQPVVDVPIGVLALAHIHRHQGGEALAAVSEIAHVVDLSLEHVPPSLTS